MSDLRGRANQGLTESTTVSLEPSFAASFLPLSMTIASRHKQDLEMALSYLPSKWPFEDKLLARFIPKLKPDVARFHRDIGVNMGSLFRPELLARFDEELLHIFNRFLAKCWALAPSERMRFARRRPRAVEPKSAQSPIRLETDAVHSAHLMVAMVNGEIRITLTPLAQRIWGSDRRKHVLEVAEFMFERQRAFLQHGVEYLQPLTQRDVAGNTGLHEATIGRLTKDLIASTPWGLVNARSLLASAMSTHTQSSVSSRFVQELVRQAVALEDPLRPLTDDEIAQLIQARGIVIARRTVGKYRAALGIPGLLHRRQKTERLPKRPYPDAHPMVAKSRPPPP